MLQVKFDCEKVNFDFNLPSRLILNSLSLQSLADKGNYM